MPCSSSAEYGVEGIQTDLRSTIPTYLPTFTFTLQINESL